MKIHRIRFANETGPIFCEDIAKLIGLPAKIFGYIIKNDGAEAVVGICPQTEKRETFVLVDPDAPAWVEQAIHLHVHPSGELLCQRPNHEN